MRRKRRSKIKGMKKISFFYIIAIAMLNIMGISYAIWNDQVHIKSFVSTGKIEPYFGDVYVMDKQNGNGDLMVYFEDEYTINIQGQVEPGYKAVLNYDIKNKGTMPVECKEVDVDTNGLLKLHLKEPRGIVEPDKFFENTNKGAKLEIKAPKKSSGMDDFEFEMIFQQWK
ncbi:hypothetical protein QBE52_02110 [Clostridiaceae bacterium 35-E11]